MRQITLISGEAVIVDNEDYRILARHQWHLQKSPSGTLYAVRHYLYAGKMRAELMHRAVLDPPSGQLVDHRDGNGLNNTKGNLRPCTHTQNMQNRKKAKHGKSRFKGVYPEMKNGRLRWRAQIDANGSRLSSGYFEDEETPARIYDEWARQYHGEFARTNFG